MKRRGIGLLGAVALAAAGCGRSPGELPVVRDGNRLTSPSSDLVAVIPPGAADASAGELFDAYRAAARWPPCRYGDGRPVDLVLAQGCAQLHARALWPDLLPASLDGFDGVEGYVARIHEGDRFTVYYPPATYENVIAPTVRGTRASVGVTLVTTDPEGRIGPAHPLTVAQVLPYTRAWFDGLRVGDHITAVDESAVAGQTVEAVLTRIPAIEGLPVRFTVERAGQALEIDTAAQTHLAFRLEGDVAYLGVRSFADTTGRRVAEGFQRVLEEGPVVGVVLDLRADGGGSVAGALALADWLVADDGSPGTRPLLTLENRDGQRATHYLGESSSDDLPLQGPERVAVLVDAGTASAAEIVAAAVRDYGVATLVGTRTYGKGVQEDPVSLVDGSGLWVTSRRLLPPSGVSYHGTGLTPDLVVPGSPWDGTVTPDADPQLTAALTVVGAP